MIITISGKPGSGKNTVAKLLSKRLGWKYYVMGDVMRGLAKKRGLSLEAFYTLGQTDPRIDRRVDEWQRRLGQRHDRLVVVGRTSFYFIPHSVKVFLDVSLREGARRILRDKSRHHRGESYLSRHEVMAGLKRRIASEINRYGKYYHLNIFKKSHYDLWVNTTHQSPNLVVKKIIRKLKELEKVSVDKPKTRKVVKTKRGGNYRKKYNKKIPNISQELIN